ncbi:hypothetical protein ZHAS_00015617 [Anopheles sinensis]|uniref:Uncharacterized protein n=1 Tax=Anopheles sinensis TaxID=74873 RepID=A0A084WAX8_ANOSI|nr:hypothetical protein ZHAS_00015617 [Anopheles sinensis]
MLSHVNLFSIQQRVRSCATSRRLRTAMAEAHSFRSPTSRDVTLPADGAEKESDRRRKRSPESSPECSCCPNAAGD